MAESQPCLLCPHDNPPENLFCGRCGASLTNGGELVPRRERSPAAAVRALPAKLGPTGKALAAGFAALAAEAGLLWLRRRVERADQSQPPAVLETRSAADGYLISRSLEETYVWLQEGDYQRRTFARRVVASFGATKQNDGRR